ncbi:Arsenate reductase [Rosistilla carotiformis]|uniref:Arsenate reductase n=1 Tax=Rosistilla carotiformis TaxID=2528017 RepID=A0A518JT96_9BACT|nr:arsenate reductase (glutaredoxin) [Rosistilla carotiformis]QDV68769.1 Arsenate reductase [Rosistilla carotiformis]
MTTIYHNPRCSKSRAAVELLDSRKIEYTVVKYLETPPTEKELSEIVAMLGIPPQQLARRGEAVFKELGLGEKPLSDKEWLAVLAANPKLIERPIVVHEGQAAIGRPIENIAAILDN